MEYIVLMITLHLMANYIQNLKINNICEIANIRHQFVGTNVNIQGTGLKVNYLHQSDAV
jgi:hypothetical protein